MEHDAVEHGACDHGIGEDLSPRLEALVAGDDDDARPLVAARERHNLYVDLPQKCELDCSHSLLRTATLTSSASDLVRSFNFMCDRCTSTVLGLRPSSRAICFVLIPATISDRTCRSRRVRWTEIRSDCPGAGFWCAAVGSERDPVRTSLSPSHITCVRPKSTKIAGPHDPCPSRELRTRDCTKASVWSSVRPLLLA